MLLIALLLNCSGLEISLVGKILTGGNFSDTPDFFWVFANTYEIINFFFDILCQSKQHRNQPQSIPFTLICSLFVTNYKNINTPKI